MDNWILDRLIFDFDEVVVDNTSMVVETANELGIDHSIVFEKLRIYEIEKNNVGVTYEDLSRIFKIIEEEKELEYKTYDGAIEVLNYIAERKCVMFASARRKEPTMLLDRIFEPSEGKFEKDEYRKKAYIFDCCHGVNKANAIIKRGKNVIIEDRLETCFDLWRQGITPIVYHKPWNDVPHPFKVVHNWNDIAYLVGMK